MNDIEIHKTANGYLVTDITPASHTQSYSDMRTFESFDSMVEWLRDNFNEYGSTIKHTSGQTFTDPIYWGGKSNE